MSSGTRWRKEQAAQSLAPLLSRARAVDPVLDSAVPIVEADRTKWRRRLQQRRCLKCGAADLANHQTSYFCQAHIANWRYCSSCETLRTAEEHGKDSRCKGCAGQKALAQYYANPDRCLYRMRLKALAKRDRTRSEQVFDGIRRRIALADLVRRTPHMSWVARCALVGADATYLAEAYRKQCRGDVRDADAIDRARLRKVKG